ncbi:MAG: NAD(P)H-dependent flavin oxidoreductase [Candidatus Freyarchaeota archaeon]
MPKINTISDILGIEYPIIGAPMFMVSYEELAVAVSEAGGLGCIPLPNYRTIDELKSALSNIRRATSKPIGVNIHLSGKFDWREQLKVCLDAGVDLFITSLGDPSIVVKDIHDYEAKIFTSVSSLKHALEAEKKGVDGIIAVGYGAGGHGGNISTMVLVPCLAEKTNLPIVAAGGIATGAQMAAAFCLGACGVVIGTRLIASLEARASREYKQAVIEASAEDIVYTDRITGNFANWIRKSIVGWNGPPDLDSEEWKNLWSAGQSVAQVNEIKKAGEIIKEIMEDFKRVSKELEKVIASLPRDK